MNEIASLGAAAHQSLRVPALSQSIAKILLAQSPLHAWYAHPALNPNYKAEEKPEFDLGTAAHSALLENGRGIVVINPEDFRSKPTKDNPLGNIPKGWTNDAIREARDDVRSQGKAPVLPWQKADIDRMVDAARKALASCTDLSGLSLENGAVEVELQWQEAGTHMRSRLDWLAHDRRVILDYKSTTDASPEAFNRQIARMGYHIQEAFYRRAVKATGGPDARFVFLAQENKAPYDCSFHGVAPSLQQIGEEQVELAIRIWRDCLARDRWPGYSNRIHYAEAQNYQIQQHEDRMNGNPYEIEKLWSKP